MAEQPTGGLVWQGERQGDPTHPGLYILTDVAMNVYGSPSKPPTESFPLWTISKAEARINAGQALRGVGDVALTIAYPGYGGRATQVLRGVPETDRAAAMISRIPRLTRLRQGVGRLTGPVNHSMPELSSPASEQSRSPRRTRR